jgi:energy-converting hydrogenase A subunit C
VAELIALYVCGLVALFAAIRTVIEPHPYRKLPYLNVMNFAIAGLIVLILSHPLSILAAAAYFVGSTLEANAIASARAAVMGDD